MRANPMRSLCVLGLLTMASLLWSCGDEDEPKDVLEVDAIDGDLEVEETDADLDTEEVPTCESGSHWEPAADRCCPNSCGPCSTHCPDASSCFCCSMPCDDEELDVVEIDDTAPSPLYRYVRIDDLSPTTDAPAGGADIDAVILFEGEVPVFADNLELYVQGGMGEINDPMAVLGPPDAFYDYPNTAVCSVEEDFASLGGIGGSVIVRMAFPIETGDELTVLEVGNCDFGSGTAIAEEVEVSVGTSANADGQWVTLGSGWGPELAFTVPTLP